MKLKHLFLIIPIALVVLYACKKDNEPMPDNPYDSIDRGDTSDTEIPVDSLTITYLHQKVLSSRCALPGCHVGNFEPDFRTPQSSFSTLVYAPVVKNNAANQFKFRVVPYDKDMSVLYHRVTNCCFVNNNDIMPQDNIGVGLPDSSRKLIERWISSGAKDMFGNVAAQPNNEPVVGYYAAVSSDYQTTYSTNRLDSIYYNPFILPASVSSFIIGVQVTDDITPVSQLTYNKLKISTDADDFSSAITLPATYVNGGNFEGYLVTVNTASLPLNDTLFMRYYVSDGRPTPTEFPRNESLPPYKTFYSFIRQ